MFCWLGVHVFSILGIVSLAINLTLKTPTVKSVSFKRVRNILLIFLVGINPRQFCSILRQIRHYTSIEILKPGLLVRTPAFEFLRNRTLLGSRLISQNTACGPKQILFCDSTETVYYLCMKTTCLRLCLHI